MIPTIIVAIAENGVIGNKEGIPWRLSADMKRYVALTKFHTMIMGRKTHESIIAKLGKPLPDRKTIVITRQKDFKAPGCTVVSSIEEALLVAEKDTKPDEEVFINGGAEIYSLALPFTRRMYITKVHTSIEGDTKFPEWNKDEWNLINSEVHFKDEKNEYDYTFLTYERRS
jgi:dihydrofolate reductase